MTETDAPTHRCRICDAKWRFYPADGITEGSWSLRSPVCGKCCDNMPMGKQIAPLAEYRGWSIEWDYGWWTATGPNYDASYEGEEDGWVDNGHRVTARTRDDLIAEVDAWLAELPLVISKKRCPCRPTCRAWFLTGIGSFVQGSGFTEQEADALIAAWNNRPAGQGAALADDALVLAEKVISNAIAAAASTPEPDNAGEAGERVPAALWPFIAHHPDCVLRGHWMEAADHDCDCGLAEALATTPQPSELCPRTLEAAAEESWDYLRDLMRTAPFHHNEQAWRVKARLFAHQLYEALNPKPNANKGDGA